MDGKLDKVDKMAKSRFNMTKRISANNSNPNNCEICKKSGHTKDTCYFMTGEYNGPGTGKRFKCGKTGHLEKDCAEKPTPVTLVHQNKDTMCFVTCAEQPYKLPCVFEEKFRVDTLLDTRPLLSFILSQILEQMEKEGEWY